MGQMNDVTLSRQVSHCFIKHIFQCHTGHMLFKLRFISLTTCQLQFFITKVLLKAFLVVNQTITNCALLGASVFHGSNLTITTSCNQSPKHVFFLVTQALKTHINAWTFTHPGFTSQNMFLMKLFFPTLPPLVCHHHHMQGIPQLSLPSR